MKKRHAFLSLAGLAAVMAMMLTLTTSGFAAIGTQDGIGTMIVVASDNKILQLSTVSGGVPPATMVSGQTSSQMVSPATIPITGTEITLTAVQAPSFAQDASIAGSGALAITEPLVALNPGGGFHAGKMLAVSSAIVAASANGSDTKGGGTFHAENAFSSTAAIMGYSAASIIT